MSITRAAVALMSECGSSFGFAARAFAESMLALLGEASDSESGAVTNICFSGAQANRAFHVGRRRERAATVADKGNGKGKGKAKPAM
jgi:hypothetical protein